MTGPGAPDPPGTEGPPTAVLVYGSCVGRDSLEGRDPARHTLVDYVARQSVISTYAEPVPPRLPPPEGLSPFQARMLAGDLEGSLTRVLRERAADTDVVLWDLTDERLGVYRWPDGAVATRSIELLQCDLDRTVAEQAEHLPLGSPEHLRLWRQAARRLVDDVAAAGARLVLLDVPWASRADDGTPVPTSFGVDAARAHLLYAPYLEHASAVLRLPTVRLTPHEAVASASHRWGLAPFHYTDAVYATVRDRLDEVLAAPT